MFAATTNIGEGLTSVSRELKYRARCESAGQFATEEILDLLWGRLMWLFDIAGLIAPNFGMREAQFTRPVRHAEPEEPASLVGRRDFSRHV